MYSTHFECLLQHQLANSIETWLRVQLKHTTMFIRDLLTEKMIQMTERYIFLLKLQLKISIFNMQNVK